MEGARPTHALRRVRTRARRTRGDGRTRKPERNFYWKAHPRWLNANALAFTLARTLTRAVTRVCRRQGVLVKTGVYKEGDETNGAAVVVQGIGQAVDWILEQEAKME
eukprot:5892640-Prymnesium_polylepis.1